MKTVYDFTHSIRWALEMYFYLLFCDRMNGKKQMYIASGVTIAIIFFATETKVNYLRNCYKSTVLIAWQLKLDLILFICE